MPERVLGRERRAVDDRRLADQRVLLRRMDQVVDRSLEALAGERLGLAAPRSEAGAPEQALGLRRARMNRCRPAASACGSHRQPVPRGLSLGRGILGHLRPRRKGGGGTGPAALDHGCLAVVFRRDRRPLDRHARGAFGGARFRSRGGLDPVVQHRPRDVRPGSRREARAGSASARQDRPARPAAAFRSPCRRRRIWRIEVSLGDDRYSADPPGGGDRDPSCEGRARGRAEDRDAAARSLDRRALLER